jgi:hypothetical protein
VYQVGSYQITLIGPTERLCWKPSIYGNICQHRDQTKDALSLQETTYERQRCAQWASCGPIRRYEGAALHPCGSLLELLSESKADFWLVMNSPVHESPWPSPTSMGITLYLNLPLSSRCRNGQLARTSDVGGKPLVYVKV